MTSYEHKVKNIYLGGPHRERRPGPNTIAYYKFDGNLNDSSGNNKNLTASGTSPTYGTNYITLDSSRYLSCANFDNFTHDWTLNLYARIKGFYRGNACHFLSTGGSTSSNRAIFLGVYSGNDHAQGESERQIQFARTKNDKHSTDVITLNQRENIVYTYNYSDRKAKAYINGNCVLDTTFDSQYSLSRTDLSIGASTFLLSEYGYRINGDLSEYIFESRARTTEEISYYHNGTKSNYGIS